MAASAEPRLSVVIPTLGRPKLLKRVLDLLERQDLVSSSFEVLVVADAQVAASGEVEGVLGSRPYEVRPLQASTPGASAARNAGWRAAAAPLILFLGDDIFPHHSLLEQHLRWHSRHPEAEVGVLGDVRWSRELRITPFMRWLEQGIQSSYDTLRGPEAGWWRLYTTNVSLKRELLERVGGFDEQLPFLYEDTDLGRRLSEHGLRLLYNPEARAEHHHPTSLDEWRGRVAAIATAEHRYVTKHSDAEPYFLPMFESAQRRPRAGRLGVRLAAVVPRKLPWLGPRVWARARRRYLQELAPSFLEAWARADEGAATAEGERSQAGGA